MRRGKLRHFRQGSSRVLVSVGNEYNALTGFGRRGVQLGLGGAQRLLDIGCGNDAGIVHARGVEGLSWLRLSMGILREADYADLVDGSFGLLGLRHIALNGGPLVVP